VVTGVKAILNASHGIYFSTANGGSLSGVYSSSNTGDGVNIGTNTHFSVHACQSSYNTGWGFRFTNSPTTANTSTLEGNTSKNNTAGSYSIAANWNQNDNW
jgi:hypothetical protein